MAKLTLKDLPQLLNRELVVIKSARFIPELNISGPIVRPILLEKHVIRSLIVTGHELHLYKTVSSVNMKKLVEVPKEADAVKAPVDEKPSEITEPEVLIGHPDPQGEPGIPGVEKVNDLDFEIKTDKETESDAVEEVDEDTTVKIIYTFDDLKTKSISDLKAILKERNIDFNSNDKNAIINKIIRSNPEA